jgi:hypothetical protein
MQPDTRFLSQPKPFWAYVRVISEAVGYTARKTGQVVVPAFHQITNALEQIGCRTSHVTDGQGRLTEFGQTLLDYFAYRANVLNSFVASHLMDVEQAKSAFEELKAQLSPQCPIPMNKQKGEKKAPAYFTGIINMLIEANIQGAPCNYNPRRLISVTHDGAPLRTLSRQVDGAFPDVANPIAVWEIKEYYHTTTFGSRVADGVYETLLDGMELEELHQAEGISVRHYLMIDARYTWWDCGRSYLCRIIDMLHMGYVDEVLVGREVFDRLPALVKIWVAESLTRSSKM